jgi:hypothetical protein
MDASESLLHGPWVYRTSRILLVETGHCRRENQGCEPEFFHLLKSWCSPSVDVVASGVIS